MSMTMITLTEVILSTIVILGSSSSSVKFNRNKGCTAPLLLPDKPFLVVWNHPSSSCRAKGIDLNFDKWGIVDNSKDSFIGEQIALFYNLGRYPRFAGNVSFNGGIPQLGNLTYHLQKVDNDINSQVPTSSFSGLGIIDFENWRPLFNLNYGPLRKYQQKSLQLAKQRFPDFNASLLLQEATKEFNEAARLFMETTLQKVALLRQSGRWGYYGYPRCWNTYCNGSTSTINDEMSWIFNSSSGLYPSIYFTAGKPGNSTASYVKKIILETLRVKATWSPQDAAILPYAYIQDSPYDFFSHTDLSYSIKEPADMGSSGVVLWGSSNDMKAKNECIALQAYINTTLGPFVLQVTSFFSNCSQQLCQSHGRCVRIDYEQFFQYHLQKSGHTECSISDFNFIRKKSRALMFKNIRINKNEVQNQNIAKDIIKDKKLVINMKPADPNNLYVGTSSQLLNDFENYICKCFAGWSGTHCEKQI